MEMTEKTLSSQQVYDGKIVKVFKDDVEISDGHKSFREVVKHSGGVVVLAVKSDGRKFGGQEDKLVSEDWRSGGIEVWQLSEEQKARSQDDRLVNESNLSEISQEQQTDKLAYPPLETLPSPNFRWPFGREVRSKSLISGWGNVTDKNPSTLQPLNPSTNNYPPPQPSPSREEGACHDNPSTLQPFNLSTGNSLPSYPPTFQPSILFVRQYRYPIAQLLLELPAGKLEYGEDPFLAAKRELEEETGYCANKWTDLGYVYTSPGYSDEKLYLYMAEDLEFTHCHPDDGEILEPLEISYQDALKMIKEGEITDAKTLCAFMKAGLL